MRAVVRKIAGGLAVAVGLTVAAVTLPSWSAPAPASKPAKEHGPPSATVTLITGDVVELTTSADGRQAATVVAPRTGMAYQTNTVNGDVSVLPLDAVALVGSGRVDERLFNVSLLVRLKYDDANQSEIPLLVAGGPAGLAARTKHVGGIDLRPMRAKKSEATPFWDQARGRTTARTIAPGIDRLWLDGKAFVSLDQSREQIGVPTAWAAGLTGREVKVAVLDTGYDTRHPDLAGRILASRDFLESPEGIEDIVGHGTHVASIVGGSGAASSGTYRGVAPDANLLVGKVCSREGCPESAILAGMSWAVEQGAKVVNLSLGCPPRFCRTDGTDPLAQGLNALAEQSGALFVVSAGNNGLDGGVGTPAVADHALAVGSVDRQNFPSYFSDRGPRPGDFAVKPDIAAPGENIVAAKAAQTLPGGTPIGTEYQTMTGTSMAAPHVSAAAAILAQQHPGWTGAQLKAGLMSTSRASEYATVFMQGAGRVDVARSVTQPVTAEVGSVSFGNFPWPHTGQRPVTRTVSYRNDGGADVTLALNLSMTDSNMVPAPAGVFQLDRNAVTVPAHGTAAVALTLDPHRGFGLFGGYLVGSTVDGAVRVTTAVSARSEEERYTVTMTVRHRDGSLATDCSAAVRAVLRVSGGYEEVFDRGTQCTDANGVVTMRTRPGHLMITATAQPIDENYYARSLSTVAFPDVNVTADAALVADTRITKPVTVAVSGEPTARTAPPSIGWYLGNGFAASGEISAPVPIFTATSGARAHDFGVAVRATAQQPLVSLRLPGGADFALKRNSRGGLLLGERRAVLVDGGAGSADELAAIRPAGKIVFVQPDGNPNEVFAALAAAGALAAVMPALGGVPFRMDSTPLAVLITDYYGGRDLTAALARGPVAVTSTGVRNSPFRYELLFTDRGGLPTGATYQANKNQLAGVTTRYHHAGEDVSSLSWVRATIADGPTYYGSGLRLLLPAEQQVYYTPGSTSWSAETRLGELQDYLGSLQVSPPTTYKARQTTTESWFVAPAGSRLTAPTSLNYGVPWVYRVGNYLGVGVPMLSDANSVHIGFGDLYRGDTGWTVLSRNGKEVGRSDAPGTGGFLVPSGTGNYRLQTEIVSDHPPFWTLGTKVNTVWTFRSGAVADLVALPLLDVDWRLPVDLANSLPAGRASDADLMVSQQVGSPTKKVASVTAQVSFDGGATWKQASVNKSGDHWRVRLPGGGRAGGYVALRVKAVATDGTSIEETVQRAYALR